MKRLPMRFFRLLGHLSHRSCKQKSRRLSRRWQSLTKAGLRCYHMHFMSIVLQVRSSTGASPPPSLSIQLEGHASRGGRSSVNRSPNEIQAWLNLNSWQRCTTLSKEFETNFQQEGSSPWISRSRLYAQKGTIFPTRL